MRGTDGEFEIGTAVAAIAAIRSRPRIKLETTMNVTILKISRRTFLQGTAAGLVAVGSSSQLALAAEVTIGIVYVGPRDDYGCNQAHAIAINSWKSLPGVKAVEEENVPETDAFAK